jgi:hypothetical protein
MALFAIWLGDAGKGATLPIDAHIVPERTISHRFETGQGAWNLSAFACASHFYTADAQVWIDPDGGGACVIHGLIWRTGDAALLDARAVAALLGAPGARLPGDVAGEYAIARLHADGTLEAFGDPAGLHQIFLAERGSPIVASRAAFVAALMGDRNPDRDSALWLGTIGYRIGSASGWDGVRQLEQGGLLSADASGMHVRAAPLALPGERGFDPDLLAEGLEEAKAAIRLAAGDGPLDLPITGGKDSRVVLAIALAAGFRDRLTLFTRGYAGHPDAEVGAAIAARIGVPHRREPPLGSDLPADLGPQAFLARLRTIAFQTDGGMGGWDNVAASEIGRGTIVSGHFGEVLKAYAKRMPEERLDPAGMVRLQAPFDPMEVLRPEARARLIATLQRQMDEGRAAGGEETDLPDLFYWRNRVPNWLGGIRGVKSFERQPVLPLGVPALTRLAFRMTAAERKTELAHFRLIEAAAPELIDLPFAHQSWHPSLRAEPAAPVLAAADAPLFGSWQWSVNRVPGVRAALAELFASTEIPLWEDIDRARLIDLLHQRRFDYFDLISLLGFAAAAIHQAGLALPARLGEEPVPLPPDPIAPTVTGHVDLIRVADEKAEIYGWAWAPDWPGAAVAVQAALDGRVVAAVSADQNRPDLAAAGIGDGRHAFTIRFDAALLDGAEKLVVAGVGSPDPLGGGERTLEGQLPRDA